MSKFNPKHFIVELYKDMWKLLKAVITFDDGKQRSVLGELFDVFCSLGLILTFHVVLIAVAGGVVWALYKIMSWLAYIILVGVIIAVMVWDKVSENKAATAVANQQRNSLKWDEIAAFVVVPICQSMFGNSWSKEMLQCQQQGSELIYDISAANLSDQNTRITLERRIMRRLSEVYKLDYEKLFLNKVAVVHGSRLIIK